MNIGNNGILKYLKKNDVDFIAYVMTQWHVHSLEAAVEKIQTIENRALRGIVVVKPHPKSGFLLNETSFSNTYNAIYYYEEDEKIQDVIKTEIKGILYYLGLKKDNKQKFYVLRPTGFRYPILGSIQYAVGKKKSITLVQLDEGTATYLRDSKQWISLTVSEQSNLKGKIKAYIKYFEGKMLKPEKIKITEHFINACLFELDKFGKCNSNEDMAIFYRKAIKKFSSKVYTESFSDDSRYVIISTQFVSIFKNGYLISDKILKECIKVFTNNGYRVLLKPHPRDNDIQKYKNLGIQILESNISQESMLATAKIMPKFMIGFFSTSLVTANVLFDIKTISLNDIVMESGEFSDSSEEIIQKFKNTFEDYVVFVQNYTDIEEIIRHDLVEGNVDREA